MPDGEALSLEGKGDAVFFHGARRRPPVMQIKRPRKSGPQLNLSFLAGVGALLLDQRISRESAPPSVENGCVGHSRSPR